jgi:ribosome maturation factor RimP
MRNTQLEDIIMPVVNGLGYELWGIEYLPQGKHSVLRVYIETEQGILIEDCEKVSRQLSAVLDVEEPISGHYVLEVSSPGLDRPLFNAKQYQRYLGQRIQIRVRRPIDGRRRFVGTLQAASDEELTLDIEGTELRVALAEVDKGHLV